MRYFPVAFPIPKTIDRAPRLSLTVTRLNKGPLEHRMLFEDGVMAGVEHCHRIITAGSGDQRINRTDQTAFSYGAELAQFMLENCIERRPFPRPNVDQSQHLFMATVARFPQVVGELTV